MAEGEGKRDYVRVNNEFSVRLVKKGDPGSNSSQEIKTSKAINVSAGGLLINTDEKLDVDAILNITFLKPNTFDFFRGVGKVVRVEEDTDKTYKVAVAFINLSAEDMRMLDYYIKLGEK
jgi:hypothetical protein